MLQNGTDKSDYCEIGMGQYFCLTQYVVAEISDPRPADCVSIVRLRLTFF